MRILAWLLASTLMLGSNLSACQLLTVLGADPHHHETADGEHLVHAHESHSCCAHDHHHHHHEDEHDHHAVDTHHHPQHDTPLPCEGECQLDPDANLSLALQPAAPKLASAPLPAWQEYSFCRSAWKTSPGFRAAPIPLDTGPPPHAPPMSGRFLL